MNSKRVLVISFLVILVGTISFFLIRYGLNSNGDGERIEAYISSENEDYITLRHPAYDLKIDIPTDWEYSILGDGLGSVDGDFITRSTMGKLGVIKVDQVLSESEIKKLLSSYQYVNEVEGGYEYVGKNEVEGGDELSGAMEIEDSFVIGRWITEKNGSISISCSITGNEYRSYINDCIQIIQSVKVGR